MSAGTESEQPDWRRRAGVYARLMRLDRPIGTLLLLWPTAWALWLAAEGLPHLHLLVIFGLGVWLMRSAGCVINDYADRGFDPHVSRTTGRPLATGEATPREALALFSGLCLIAFALVLLTNALTVLLALVAVALAAFYPFAKRHTHLPQMVLGAAFGWAIPMAFAAQTGTVPSEAWLLFVANLLWTTAYDTMYGMVDREDDLRIGVKSTAILFGDLDRFWIGVFQAAALLALFLFGARWEMGAFYYMGLTVAAGLAIYHQVLIRRREPAECFRAFLHNNWFGMAVFVGIVVDYMLRL
ncbi:MAG: 4-hydroxybenzoate octaprenyltransferase [Pseudomonadota bacterium]